MPTNVRPAIVAPAALDLSPSSRRFSAFRSNEVKTLTLALSRSNIVEKIKVDALDRLHFS